MIFGYARVSTKDQNLERQLAVLEQVCDKIVTGKGIWEVHQRKARTIKSPFTSPRR